MAVVAGRPEEQRAELLVSASVMRGLPVTGRKPGVCVENVR